MSIFETILPNNATAFEKSLEEAANFPQLPIDELADLVNPWKIDARYLPWLAYRFCIEIWQDHWPEEKKRSVIARALELQRIKGTEKGLRDYVKLADGQVKQIVVPPQHFWAGKGLSAAEINAWHETMPQIRIYFVLALPIIILSVPSLPAPILAVPYMGVQRGYGTKTKNSRWR